MGRIPGIEVHFTGGSGAKVGNSFKTSNVPAAVLISELAGPRLSADWLIWSRFVDVISAPAMTPHQANAIRDAIKERHKANRF